MSAKNNSGSQIHGMDAFSSNAIHRKGKECNDLTAINSENKRPGHYANNIKRCIITPAKI